MMARAMVFASAKSISYSIVFAALQERDPAVSGKSAEAAREKGEEEKGEKSQT
jgi:hypothetical protein